MSVLVDYFSNILYYDFDNKKYKVFEDLCKNDYLNFSFNQLKEIFIFAKRYKIKINYFNICSCCKAWRIDFLNNSKIIRIDFLSSKELIYFFAKSRLLDVFLSVNSSFDICDKCFNNKVGRL